MFESTDQLSYNDPATAAELHDWRREQAALAPAASPLLTWSPRPAPPPPGGRPQAPSGAEGISTTYILVSVGVVGALAAGIWWYTSKPKRRRRR